jgi:hypothetical protein
MQVESSQHVFGADLAGSNRPYAFVGDRAARRLSRTTACSARLIHGTNDGARRAINCGPLA